MTYSLAQFLDYVSGWLDSEAVDKNELTMEGMIAALHNAKNAIDDPSDGIAAEIERIRWEKCNHYRFEGKHARLFFSDAEAFDYACGWHDDRNASVEKWIDFEWCRAASPVYHPQHFENGGNGGWITNKGLVEYDS